MNNFDVPALFWREGEGVTMCMVKIKDGKIYDPVIRAHDLPSKFLINLNANKVLRYTTGDYSVIVGGIKHTHQHLLELYIEER